MQLRDGHLFHHITTYTFNEYIFDVNSDEANKYEVYGEFVTSNGPIEGNWKITFPLETLNK